MARNEHSHINGGDEVKIRNGWAETARSGKEGGNAGGRGTEACRGGKNRGEKSRNEKQSCRTHTDLHVAGNLIFLA